MMKTLLRGCKPEPQKFPSLSFQSRNNHIQVDQNPLLTALQTDRHVGKQLFSDITVCLIATYSND